ncbi:MAG TPA: response regulator [Candidatus Obscuribacterales bacterium]
MDHDEFLANLASEQKPAEEKSNLPNFNVLLVEDTMTQTALVKRMLKFTDRGHFAITSVRTLQEAVGVTDMEQFDVILLDLGLPDSTGVETLAAMYDAAGIVPIVVFTSDSEENMGMELIRRGAQDYVQKSAVDVDSLTRAIIYASERRKLTAKLVAAQRIFASFMQNNPVATFVFTEDGEKLYSNSKYGQTFSSRAQSANVKLTDDSFISQTRPEELDLLRKGIPIEMICKHETAAGQPKDWLIVKFPFLDPLNRQVVGGTAIDVTDFEKSKEALRQTREMFQVFFYHSNMPQAILGPDLAIRRVNQAYCKMLGFDEGELVNRPLKDLTAEKDWTVAESILSTRELHASTQHLVCRSGRYITVSRSGRVVFDADNNPAFIAVIDQPVES